MNVEVSPVRRAELEERLHAVRERIAAACTAAGRAPEEVELLAVTKTIPAADVIALAELGLRDFGENRAQEAALKVAEIRERRPDLDLRWHFIGGLQRNKVRVVAPWVTRVETVDSARLAAALDKAAAERGTPLPVLIQYSVDGDPARGGVDDAGLLDLAAQVTQARGLVLEGLLSVAPLGADDEESFAAIAAAGSRLRAAHPGATVLSAGMSGDLEVAIRHGSTVARVGTALVGDRRLTSR
ncbi:YggS family pyridoxal phosphate-dependent enzyme [Pseudonocardia sp. WMMC193]|uniref:YggS family pyridoxal phosphate-dependent enzyme n=1 Tax=Pseudonocardia sp. WMMC193 TaxID=2911965 RepID=UPI001F023A2F|nr:YggS family pyridoxal phosphate-dependent enzyme [Pseudonocardia sp. WMMC193]MCF7548371.1 YggS family pyridoxal phosphate-dependent enzyme [Pseudonocardia sp. WMMC193]